MSDKLTRKELREDPIIAFFTGAYEWVETHSREVLIGLGAVVLLVVLAIFWQGQGRRNEEQAAELLLRGKYQMMSGDYNGALAAFKEIQQRYAGTPTAKRALRDEADANFDMGKIPEAQRLYQKFADKVGTRDIEGRAGLTGVAACLEQQRQFDKAAEAYGKVADLPEGGDLTPMALWAQGRCWAQAGKFDKSEAAYQRILSEHRTSRYAGPAREAIAEVKARAAK